jgi:hypothetical protein
MISIATIVEGDGEVAALPILLRRMAAEWSPAALVNPLQPIRVRRDRFIQKEEEFRRQLLLAAAKSGADGWILILLDADDDCPARLGQALYQRALQHVPHRRVSVVLANREFEAWFIAAAPSLNGARGFSIALDQTIEAEVPRDAKGWLRERMKGGTYSPLLDQPAFTALFDLQQAFDHSRSFRKLCKEWQHHVSQRA